MKRKSFSLIMAVILMLVAIPVAATGVAVAQETTLVYISPASQTVAPGQTFTVDIYVEPAEPILTVSSNLSFDHTLLTADSCEKGDVLQQVDAACTPPPDCTFFHSVIYNDTGTISPIWSYILPGDGGPWSDPGSWVTITFTAGETTGTSSLDLSGVDVKNADNVSIETDVTGGSVTIEEPPTNGGGCFIATAAYGSYLDSHVETLQDFRDQYLVTNPVGQALVSTYYKVSPPIADFIDDHPTLKPIVRVGLLPAVAMSTVAVNTTSAEKAAIMGSLALVSVALSVWLRRRRGKGVIS